MLYTIGEAASKVGIPASALRYYDKEGLLPHVKRSSGGVRVFGEEDFEWIRFIERLKASGMPIKEIKRYVDLQQQGDATIAERRELVYARKAAVEEQMAKLQQSLDFLTYKCWYYDRALECGTTQVPHDMSLDEMPPDIREIKMRCGVYKYGEEEGEK